MSLSENVFVDNFIEDPHAAYAKLRDETAVRHVVLPDGLPVYFVSRYAEARAALNDDRLAHHLSHAKPALDQAGIFMSDERVAFGGSHMLHSDPPEHPRLRRLVSRAFTAAHIEGMRPAIERLTAELLDGAQTAGEIDLVDLLAYPLPVLVICELLGVPAQDRNDFRKWSDATLASDFHDDHPISRAEGKRLLREYMAALIERKRAVLKEGNDDLISTLIRQRERDGDDALTEEELVATAFLLLVAGHESTVNFLSTSMLAIASDEQLQSLLREQPDLLLTAVDEFLRYDGPVQRGTIRTAVEEVALGDVQIPAGSIVSIGLASANRDPRQFPDAEEVDVDRRDNPHLAFGHGRHFCLGAPLARMEGQIALRALLDRYSHIALACEPAEVEWRRSFQRGLLALPVRVTPARSGR